MRQKGRYKIVFNVCGGNWQDSRRRKSLSAALCRARRMNRARYQDVRVIDTNNGKVWLVDNENGSFRRG